MTADLRGSSTGGSGTGTAFKQQKQLAPLLPQLQSLALSGSLFISSKSYKAMQRGFPSAAGGLHPPDTADHSSSSSSGGSSGEGLQGDVFMGGHQDIQHRL